MIESRAQEHVDWSLRPWLLAGGLALAGLLVWLASPGAEDVPWRMAATAFVFFASLAAAFTLEPGRWKQPAVFSLLAGIVMAGLAWRAVSAGDHYADPEYGFAAGVFATGLALPLFQSGLHRTRFATPYERVHYNVWSDAIAAAGSLAFVGASWLLLLLLSQLFLLLKVDFLRELMDEGWFGWTFSGAAFGAALGTLRNQQKIVGSLQQVGTLVLSILAVPLALGLALFLVAMIFSGPEVLWAATRSATPVLLACAAGAWVLANAILRDSDAAMSGNRILRWAAWALALSILPLTVFAAVSLGTRIDQHGLSPERLWGLVAIAVACAYGLAWLVALVRGWRGNWRDRLRQANLHLAAAICVVALILALPIFDFGAVSARNQLARLQNGDVSVEEFDFAALRWDFGDAGRRALARLQQSNNARIAELATLVGKQTQRPILSGRYNGTLRDEDELDVRIQPADDPELRRLVIDYMRANDFCPEFCIALDLGTDAEGKRDVAFINRYTYSRVSLPAEPEGSRQVEPAQVAEPDLKPDSKVEIRTAQQRYIFVDGKRHGPPLDDD